MWVKAESHDREVTAESPWQRDIAESHEESHSKRPGAGSHSRDSGLTQQRFRALTEETQGRPPQQRFGALTEETWGRQPQQRFGALTAETQGSHHRELQQRGSAQE